MGTPLMSKCTLVGLCLETYGGLRGGAISYERGIPVGGVAFTTPVVQARGLTGYVYVLELWLRVSCFGVWVRISKVEFPGPGV